MISARAQALQPSSARSVLCVGVGNCSGECLRPSARSALRVEVGRLGHDCTPTGAETQAKVREPLRPNRRRPRHLLRLPPARQAEQTGKDSSLRRLVAKEGRADQPRARRRPAAARPRLRPADAATHAFLRRPTQMSTRARSLRPVLGVGVGRRGGGRERKTPAKRRALRHKVECAGLGPNQRQAQQLHLLRPNQRQPQCCPTSSIRCACSLRRRDGPSENRRKTAGVSLRRRRSSSAIRRSL